MYASSKGSIELEKFKGTKNKLVQDTIIFVKVFNYVEKLNNSYRVCIKYQKAYHTNFFWKMTQYNYQEAFLTFPACF